MSSIAPCKLLSIQNSAIDEAVSEPSSTHRVRPLSLRPGEQVVIAAAMGNKLACAIRDAWRPRFDITIMTGEELATLSDRCSVTFIGSGAEIV